MIHFKDERTFIFEMDHIKDTNLLLDFFYFL